VFGDEKYKLHPIDFEKGSEYPVDIIRGVKLFLLLFGLFSFMVLTAPEYIQCKHCEPDEFLDLFGIPGDSTNFVCQFISLPSLVLHLLLLNVGDLTPALPLKPFLPN